MTTSGRPGPPPLPLFHALLPFPPFRRARCTGDGRPSKAKRLRLPPPLPRWDFFAIHPSISGTLAEPTWRVGVEKGFDRWVTRRLRRVRKSRLGQNGIDTDAMLGASGRGSWPDLTGNGLAGWLVWSAGGPGFGLRAKSHPLLTDVYAPNELVRGIQREAEKSD